MRASLRASDTALRATLASPLAGLLAILGCSHAAPRPAPPRQPPPHVLVVGLPEVALRTTAWVELHAWLAAAARSSDKTGDPELDEAANAYAAVLAADDRDTQLGQTTSTLGACDTEKCARAAVTGTRFASPYLASVTAFQERHWMQRAATARAGIEVARAALGPEVEGLVARLAGALAVEWPTKPPVVDVVTEAPAPGRDAPIPAALGARSSCFSRTPADSDRMHSARITACVLTYAAVQLEAQSAIGTAMTARGSDRAWVALVVHAVATLVSAWEPRHTTPLRRSAEVAMPNAMAWLAREWPSRLRGEAPAVFAKRYTAALAEAEPEPR